MQSQRYLFVIFFFFVFLTVLIVFIMPAGPGRSKITSHFSVSEVTGHVSQVPEGTNTTAHIIVDNARIGAYDLINYSFRASIYANTRFAPDINVINQTWIQNFTLSKGDTLTILLVFSANTSLYPGETIKEFYIQVEWGAGITLADVHRFSGLNTGSTYEKPSFFTLSRIFIILAAIGMGAMVLILILGARKDYRKFRMKRRPPRAPSPPAPPVPPSTPPAQTTTEPAPTETMELFPCPGCGSKIDKTQVICPNCGHELPKCAICNLVIDEDDPIETCPECGTIGHRAHFREWVHVKGFCPICKKPIAF